MVVEMCKGGQYYYFLPMQLAYQIGKIEASLKKDGGLGGAGISTVELILLGPIYGLRKSVT